MELHFDTIARVLETWDAARRKCKDFEAEFGHVFINRSVSRKHTERSFVCTIEVYSPSCSFDRFIELQPRVKKHYGFRKDTSIGEMMMNKHAEGIVGFFDSILQLLGKEEGIVVFFDIFE